MPWQIRRRKMGSLAALVLLSLVSMPLPVLAAGTTFKGPAGWRAMCALTPELCNTAARRPAAALDGAAWTTLDAVNRAVNAAILPLLEADDVDDWHLAPAAGDCEDYALTKKQRLIATGWPAADLRFATLFTADGEYHAVLFVDHADGRLVLDNLADELRSWPELEADGYRLVAVEGEGVDGGWLLTAYGSVVAMLAGHSPAATF